MERNSYKTDQHKRTILNPVVLFWFYMAVNMAPSLYFLFTQPLNRAGQFVVFLFPLGLYSLTFSLFKNTGKGQILLFPLLFLHAFQIVLFYLYGADVIAVNMFLNVATTNTAEVSEILGALLPSIAIVIVLYIPPTIAAAIQWRRKNTLSRHYRVKIRRYALVCLLLSMGLSFLGHHDNQHDLPFYEDIYPANLIYNLGFAVHKYYKIKHYPETSKDFSYEARGENSGKSRQIVVLVIGETGRADNWGLYGYARNTTPALKNKTNLVLFKDALTQSNVTHESVPIIMSSIGAGNYQAIYRRKGIFTAFKEAGFTTVALSNQAENSSFIEYFYKEADIYKNLRESSQAATYDSQLIPLMTEIIDDNTGDLFIVLHGYGSHFNYNDRYPENFKKYNPDEVTNVEKAQKTEMVNAYDNSIRFTDYFLAQTIDSLEEKKGSAILLYSADHGEDIFDDKREKFLHSSPTPTYYQLRVPFFIWFSDQYITQHHKKVAAAEHNRDKPVSTNSIFPTLLESAGIKSPYLEEDLSLLNPNFSNTERLFLNDHEKGVPYTDMSLKPEDFKMLKKHDIIH